MSKLEKAEQGATARDFGRWYDEWRKLELRESRMPSRGVDPKEQLRLLHIREKLQTRLLQLVCEMIFLETIEGQEYHLGMAIGACCRATSGPKVTANPKLKAAGKAEGA